MTEIASSVFSDYKKTNQHINFYDCHVAPWYDKKIYHFHIRGLDLCKVQKQPYKDVLTKSFHPKMFQH